MKRISISIAPSVWTECERDEANFGVPRPALERALRFVTTLQMLLASSFDSPSTLEEIRKQFAKASINRTILRSLLKSFKRLTIFIKHERISCIRVEAKFFAKGDERECGELSALFDDSQTLHTSFSWTPARVQLHADA